MAMVSLSGLTSMYNALLDKDIDCNRDSTSLTIKGQHKRYTFHIYFHPTLKNDKGDSQVIIVLKHRGTKREVSFSPQTNPELVSIITTLQ